MRAMAVPVPECANAAPQEDTRATAACYLDDASATRPADMRATAAADPEGVAAQVDMRGTAAPDLYGAQARPLRWTLARRRRPTPRARRAAPRTTRATAENYPEGTPREREREKESV